MAAVVWFIGGGRMINVTLTITGAEWGLLRDTAEKVFPNELLSRAEITRRFALMGIASTKNLSEADTKQEAHRLRSSQHVAGPGGVGVDLLAPEGEVLMRKSRYTTIQIPTWPCPYCGYVHYAADLVRLDNERLECCQCGQAFTPAKAADASSTPIGFRDSAD